MAASKIAIYGAIGANAAIAVTKFTVAALTGSSAMLSEGIHSAVDTGNGFLLLVGLSRSQKPATADHPFGHGKELYFWSLIVAVLIFGLGGGISFYEGIVHVRHPTELKDPTWNYVVLAAAAVFEGAALTVALKHFRAQHSSIPLLRAIRASKDPASFTVLAEDAAALLGLIIAAVGIYASHALDMPELDGVASICIGLVLAGVAVLLIIESRSLLVGEGVKPETAREIRRIVAQHEPVRTVGAVLSMYIGADEVLLTLDIVLKGDTPADEAARTIDAIERDIRAAYPKIKRIYIEARSNAVPPKPISPAELAACA